MLKKALLFFTFLSLLFCDKQTLRQSNSLVPAVKNFSFSVSKTTIPSPGTFTLINGQGHQGIIVFNLNNLEYRAFDLGCPYIDPSTCTTPMEVNIKTGEMRCIGCANDDITFTQYKINVAVGNNTYYLREYNAYNEGGSIRISNF